MRFHMFLHTGEKSRISCGLLAPSIHLVYIRRRSNESILGLQCIIIFRPIGYCIALSRCGYESLRAVYVWLQFRRLSPLYCCVSAALRGGCWCIIVLIEVCQWWIKTHYYYYYYYLLLLLLLLCHLFAAVFVNGTWANEDVCRPLRRVCWRHRTRQWTEHQHL